MILINSDLIFVDLSGQVRCLNADLLLKPSPSGKVLVRSRTDSPAGRYDSLMPETTLVQNLGSPDLAWGTSFISSGNFTDVYCANITVDGIARINNALISGLVVNVNATINSLTMNGSIDLNGNNLLNGSTLQGQFLDLTPNGHIDMQNGDILRSDIINCNTLRVHSSGSMKALAMSGNIDMGGNNIVTVGLVDGVDVSAHRTRHQDGGADEIDVTNLAGLLADPQNITVDDGTIFYIKNALSFPFPSVTVDGGVYFGFTVTDIGTAVQIDVNTNAATVLFNAFQGGKILKHTTITSNLIQEGHFINLSGISTSGTLNMLNRGIVNVSGIIMSTSGNIVMSSGIISGLSLVLPIDPSQAATKNFVDQRTWYCPSGETHFFEDFLIENFYHYTEVSTSGGGKFNPLPFDSALLHEDRIGVLRLSAGDQANGFIKMHTWPQTIIIGAGNEIDTIFKPDFNPLGMVVQFGFGSSTTTAENSDGIWIEYNRNISSNWLLVTARDGSIHKATSSKSVEMGAFTKFAITTSISGTNPTNNLVANYWINDILIGQKTNNIPSGAVTSRLVHPFWMVTQNQVNGFGVIDLQGWSMRKFKLR